MCGTVPALQVGGSYQLSGTYRLSSQERASLLASVTLTTRSASPPDSPWASTFVARGSGQFQLELTLHQQGFPHVTMYSPSGRPFCGLYFGHDEWLLKRKGWSYLLPAPVLPVAPTQPFQLL